LSNFVDRFFEGGDPGGQVNEHACLRRPRESTGLEATLEAETRSHESHKLEAFIARRGSSHYMEHPWRASAIALARQAESLARPVGYAQSGTYRPLKRPTPARW
jgi:hypothetical protein